jgi:hypothetical protein
MEQELKVIGFSDDQVIFENDKKDIIYWPKNQLPLVPEIGESVRFSINSNQEKAKPRDLINELLKINPEKK